MKSILGNALDRIIQTVFLMKTGRRNRGGGAMIALLICLALFVGAILISASNTPTAGTSGNQPSWVTD